jgi:hypothetical protein
MDALAVGDHDLLDFGPGRVRLLADHGDVERHLPPTINVVTEAQDLVLDDTPATLLGGEIGARQENHADAKAAGP